MNVKAGYDGSVKPGVPQDLQRSEEYKVTTNSKPTIGALENQNNKHVLASAANKQQQTAVGGGALGEIEFGSNGNRGGDFKRIVNNEGEVVVGDTGIEIGADELDINNSMDVEPSTDEMKLDFDEANNGSMEWEIMSTISKNGDSWSDDDMQSLKSSEYSDFDFDSMKKDLDDLDTNLASSFNMNVLTKAMEASQGALELVMGRDVVAVIGKTGVGKSTLIQGIAGKKIRTFTHEVLFGGQTVMKQVFEAEDALPEFEIGHETTSKTSYLNAYLNKSGMDNKTETVYLDMPGMEDTNGAEMDIATCALLSQVAKRCKSLKFIVVIHCASLLEDRGGALRGVLKFARKFVADFNEHKQSFMFLFSHSNEIKEFSGPREEAKKKLIDEIIMIMQGTKKEDDLFAVLNYIRGALKRDNQRAGIFYPSMEFSALASCIEEKMTKFTELSLAKSCNLALSPKLKLESAVQKLVQSLTGSLRGPCPDLCLVKEVMNTLDYLERFVEVDCVRIAAEKGKNIVVEYIQSTQTLIKDHSSRGISHDSEFSSENVRIISDSLQLLKQLDDSFSLDEWYEKNKRKLIDFERSAVSKVESQCLDSFQIVMKNLSVWSYGFDNYYSDLYTRACQSITRYFQEALFKMDQTDISRLENGDQSDIIHFMKSYATLHDFCERVIKYSVEGFDINGFVQVKDSTSLKLVALVEAWVDDAVKCLEGDTHTLIKDTGSFDTILRRVEVMDSMKVVLKSHFFCSTALLDKVEAASKQIERLVTGWYSSSCDDLKATSFHPEWSASIILLSDVSKKFGDLPGAEWKSIPTAYLSLLEKAKMAVSTMAHDLLSSFSIV